jgi:hypothetical protein
MIDLESLKTACPAFYEIWRSGGIRTSVAEYEAGSKYIKGQFVIGSDGKVYRATDDISKAADDMEDEIAAGRLVAIDGIPLADISDKFIESTEDGIRAYINLSFEGATGELKLLGKNDDEGEPFVVATLNLPIETFLEGAEVVTNPPDWPEGKYLLLHFNTESGEEDVYVNLQDLVDVYTGSDGIDISEANVVSIITDPQGLLSVGAEGLTIDLSDYMTGGEIQDAIESALKATLTDAAASDALPETTESTVASLLQTIRNFLKWTASLFDVDTGHDHDGENSKKVDYSDLAETPTLPTSVITGVSGTASATQYDIDFDTADFDGTEESETVSMPQATTSLAGVMAATDKAKLDGIASGAEVNVNADWDAVSGKAQILNRPDLAAVATSGSFYSLVDAPDLPSSLFLGETNTTAYRGDRGKTAYDHSQSSGNPHGTTYADLPDTPTIPDAQVNSDWNAASGAAEILNKPTIPAAQVQSDWTATSGMGQILNKPTLGSLAAKSAITSNDITDGTITDDDISDEAGIDPAKIDGLAAVATSGAYSDLSGKPTIPAAQVNADWEAVSGAAQILNKPIIPTHTQADWAQENDESLDFVKNKPTLGSLAGKSSIASDDITDGTIVNEDISESAAIAMSKISGLIAALSAKVAHKDITFPSGNTSYSVAITGMVSTDLVIVLPNGGDAGDYVSAGISVDDSTDGTLTITATTAPSVDLPFRAYVCKSTAI